MAALGLSGALRDTAIYLFAQLGARGLSFVFYFVLAGALPIDEFGYLSLALVVVILIDMVIDAGLSRFASREIARDPRQAGWIVRLFLPYKIAASLVALAAIWLVAAWTGVSDPARSIMLLSSLGLLLTAPSMLVENALQAHHKFSRISLAHIALSLSQAALGFFAIAMEASTQTVAVVFVAANAVYLAVLVPGLLQLDLAPGADERRLPFAACLKAALPFMLGAIVMLLSTRIEFFVLSWLGSPADLGVYSLIARLMEVALLAPMALGSVLLPRFAAAHAGDRAALTRVYAAGLQLLLLAAIPAAAIVWAFAFVLPLILANPALAGIGGLTAIQFLGYPFACVFVLNTFLLLSGSHQWTALAAWSVLALAQLGLNVALQGAYGIHGAVAASVVMSVVGSLSTSALIAKRYIVARDVLLAISPCAAAGLAVVAAFVALSWAGDAIALIAALCVFGVLIWRSGVVRSLASSGLNRN